MIFHVLTIFPEYFRGPFEHGVIARAKSGGKLDIRIHNLRDWTGDRHTTVDDRPFGGGEGMLLKPEPIFSAVETIFPERATGKRDPERRVTLLSAQGRRLNQAMARGLAGVSELLLVCGRYEGVDERVAGYLADDEVTIGDYVLSGGEAAAAVMVEVVARLLPGVLGNADSTLFESFESEPNVLDCPQYTRPADFRGLKVPEVLLGGNHEQIRKWRKQAALEKTARLRPDLKDGPCGV